MRQFDDPTQSEDSSGLTHRRLAKVSFWLAALVAISRLLGVALQIAVAAYFGTSAELDAYLVASSMPQLFTALYASGATIVLVPLIVAADAARRRQETERVNTAFTILCLSAVLIGILGWVFADPIMGALGYGFGPQTVSLAADQFRILMLFLVLSALGSTVMGILNARSSFIVPGVASVLQSLAWLLLLFVLLDSYGVYALALGGVGGAAVFLVSQLPSRALRTGVPIRASLRIDPTLARDVLVPFAIFALIFMSGQLNTVTDRIFASMLPAGSVSTLDYAWKFHAMLLNIIAYGIVTPAYTRMSQAYNEGKSEELRKTIWFTFRMLMLAAIPAVVVTTCLREPMIGLLLERGAFNASDTVLTARTLLYAAPAQLATAFSLLGAYALFALRDTRSLLKIAAVTVVLNITFDIMFYKSLGVVGIALSSTLAFIPTLIWLLVRLHRTTGALPPRRVAALAARCVGASLIAGVSAVFVWGFAAELQAGSLLVDATLFAATLALAGVVYVLALALFRTDEIRHLPVVGRWLT